MVIERIEKGSPYVRGWELRNGEPQPILTTAKRDLRRRRQPTFIGQLMKDYYVCDGAWLDERNPKWLQDDYVKFIRWAQWRIDRTGSGILAFITNHGYLDNPTFRGMRQQLMRSFDEIYVLDLHGNAKKKERAPDGSKDENVFDIQQGVSIGIFVKKPEANGPARVQHADLWGLRDGKCQWLFDDELATTEWTSLDPKSPFSCLSRRMSSCKPNTNAAGSHRRLHCELGRSCHRPGRKNDSIR